MRQTLKLWLTGIILLAIVSFLAVFQPMTFSARKDPSDTSSYLKPLGSKWKGPSDMPDPFVSVPMFGSKLDVFFYVPQHNLRLGLDLRGGMRVVMQIPNRTSMSFTVTPKITGQDEIIKKSSEITDAINKDEDLARSKAKVTVSEDGVSIMTQVDDRNQAEMHLQKVSKIVTAVFQGSTVVPPDKVDAIYQTTNEKEQAKVCGILNNRLNATGLTEVTVYPEGTNRVVIEVPGVKDEKLVYKIIGTTGNMEFRLIPREYRVDVDDSSGAGRIVTVTNLMSGKTLTDAEIPALINLSMLVMPGSALTSDSKPILNNNKWAVSFTIRKASAGEKNYQDIFAKVTRENNETAMPPNGAQLAIILDNHFISAPYIKSEINGNGIITGSKDEEEAKTLANFLNNGALPVPLNIMETRTVSATLGQDSINMSMTAGIVGLFLVLVFMAAYYRLPGLMADFALVVYIALTLAVFKFFDATLTLPGIAGLIISVGMAVDANVIIFERLKEELRAKKPLETAIDTAFSRAWTAILDSNMASLITGFVLYSLGTGAVKGFAITLLIGVAVSLFTAVTVTRLFLKLMVRSQSGHNLSWYGL